MNRRILLALLVFILIAGPQFFRLQAQSAALPQTYSFTQDPTLFSLGGPMATKVARDGSKELVEQTRAPSAADPKGFQNRILYDFQAHKIYTLLVSDKSVPCSVVTYTDPATPFVFDPISGEAEFMKEMTSEGKQQFKQVGMETLNGVAAKVMEYTPPPPDKGKGRLWLSQQGNYPLKLVYIMADGKQQTLFELKNLSFAKPLAYSFTPPLGCVAVSGTTNATGGSVTLPAVAPDTPAATAAPPEASSALPIGSARLARPPVVSRNGALTLQADVATTKEIEFSWAGNPAGNCNLEQKTVTGTPPVIKWPTAATSSDGKVTDSKIAPYATYVYRVTCGTKTSNEVTVGPPPAGFHTIVPRPDNHPDTSLGRFISPVLDSNGDPAVAFVYNDPNGDGKSDDTQVMFTSWDRAAYSWKQPVVVATAANFDPRPPAPCLSLTRDAQTGTYGVAWVDAQDNKTVHMALSHDDGATWAVKTAFNNAQTSAGPSLVFTAGKAYLTLEQDRTMQVIWTSGGIDEDPLQWHGGFAPMLPGNNGVSRATSLALDDKGVPAIAYWQKVNNGNLWTLTFWRLGAGGAPVKVADTGMSTYPPDGVILAFAGDQPRIMLDSRIDKAQISSHYSVFSNDGGATWSQPLPVPDDGNEHIGGYMSFAASKDGHAAFAGDVAGGNTDRMKCSWPKLARSKDLTEWVTCAPQAAQYPMVRTVWGSVIYSPSGLLYMLFQNRQTNPQQGLPSGLLIWGGQ